MTAWRPRMGGPLAGWRPTFPTSRNVAHGAATDGRGAQGVSLSCSGARVLVRVCSVLCALCSVLCALSGGAGAGVLSVH
jgi:hypothetical protein